MRAVRRNNATGQFAWIGSDGWSARALVFEGNEEQVEGTLSVQPRADPLPGFDDYFLRLTPKNNKRNPWFIEYWEHYFKCKWPNSTVTPFNDRYDNTCNEDKVPSYDNGYEPERQLQYVSNAVLAFAHALKKMHKDFCGGKPGLCAKMSPSRHAGNELLTYLKKVKFYGIGGDEFHFTENGDGPARYNIIHFKQSKPGSYQWIHIGRYEEGRLQLNLSKVQFRLETPQMPSSVCSLPCRKGQAKKFVEGEKCCWHCFNCTRYQILVTQTQCQECPLGYLPDDDKLECVELPVIHMRPDNVWAMGTMAFSSFGIIVTCYVIYVFVRHHDTPVVRASGRELCYVLLVGILMCYGMTFLLVQKPTDTICGIQKAGIGLSFTVVYSALLTKTNRISRIFKAGRQSTKRPSFISPASQLVICGCLVSVQLSITAVWLAFSPPRAMYTYPTREDNILLCVASSNGSYMIGFAYSIVLIIICTVYAIITRKIPEAFNESKYIGFTMYTTCIIWLAFVPIYFTTAYHVALNNTTMCVTISLSATVALVCLFAPKIYIILFHPEKNVRKSLMISNKCGGFHNYPQLSISSSLTRVESATQSDDMILHTNQDIELRQRIVGMTTLGNRSTKIECGTQTQ